MRLKIENILYILNVLKYPFYPLNFLVLPLVLQNNQNIKMIKNQNITRREKQIIILFSQAKTEDPYQRSSAFL